MNQITSNTTTAMSLAWSLNYRPKLTGDMLFMHRYGPAQYGNPNRILKLRGVCKRENMGEWLAERHELEIVESINYK